MLLGLIGLSIAIMGRSLTRALDNAKLTELDLRRREAHLRSILDNSPDAAVVFEANGTIVTFNAAAMRQFGYTQQEALGANVSMLLPASRQSDIDLNSQYGIDDWVRQGASRLVLGRRKNGTTFPMRLTVGEMAVEGDRYYTGFIQDLTDRQESEARLAEANNELARLARISELGEMASTLAHELNQPLSAITNYVEGCRRLLDGVDTRIAGRMRNALDESARQAMRAADIIRHQREFVARGETDKRPEDIRQLVEEAGALALIGSRQRGINRVFEFAPEAGSVMADRVQIQQVLVNLMRNAIEAMRDSERRLLLVRTILADKDRVMVEVRDSGPGLAPEIEEKLFQPFTTSKPGGMGIGLSIAKRIIEAHGGEIGFRPGENGGAVFHFSLAAADTEESERAG
ncbi:MAG TPA: PAS domain S-box protein [Devosiaceae bacterium]